MECPSCGVENASTRKFCRACGARLALVCAGCGTRNEPDDRFCGECGAALAHAPPGGDAPEPIHRESRAPDPSPEPDPGVAPGQGAPPPLTASEASAPPPLPASEASASPRPALLPAEERRLVTVLFADLVGFTALSERLDPEDVRDITTECLRRLAAEAVRFEGTVDKLIGDAIMILFGAPVAHEDDPARALRSALAMQRALHDFNRELERARGMGLRLRIGIESGEVIAGPREVGGMVEYTVIGDAVNVAARLQTAAEPGAIVVGEATCHRAGPTFQLRALDPLALKGRARPVGAAVLIGESSAPAEASPRVPLVGRSTELQRIAERLAVLRGGLGGAVVVTGAPGLGKSRLLAEPRAHADGLIWVRAQAYAHEQAESYALARSLVRALLGIDGLDDTGADGSEPAVAARVAARVTALDRAGARAPLWRLLGLPPATDADAGADGRAPRELQREMFDAVSGLVAALAAERPLVLELDDLQWADPSSLDLLTELLERAATEPVLLLCAFRPEPDAACQQLRARGAAILAERYAEIELSPLSEAASADLAARLLRQHLDIAGGSAAGLAAGAALPAALRRLLERAAGTPLWLEELMRTLVERGLLAEDGSGWRLDDTLGELDLPDSLQALIVSRIDRLGPARPTLQIAAVIGRRFGRTVLERVADTPGHLDDDLGQATRADLVRELPTRADREFHFRHVLVRDAAYATLLHRRRRALHRKVAEAVERLYPERVDEHHSLLAYHYERAEAWAEACRHARAAAEAARAGFANREAVAGYNLAMRMAELAGLGAAERGVLAEGRAGVHELLGSFEAARQDYEIALTLAVERADGPARVRILGALGMLWGGHKDYQRGVELTRQAVELARETGAAHDQAEASVQLGIMHLNLLRLGEGRRVLADALDLYRSLDDAHGQARTLDALGLLAACDGSLGDAARYLEEAHDRLAALGDRLGTASTAAMAAMAHGFAGRRAEGERLARHAAEVAREIGSPSAEAFALMILAECLDQYGAFSASLAAAERGLAIAREIDHTEWTLAALGPIGRVRRARGATAEALALHDEMLRLARSVGSALWTVEALGNVATDHLALGNLDAARAHAEDAIARGGTYQKGTLNAWLVRIRLLLADGQPADALADARAARALVSEFRVRLSEVWCLEGAALAALGRADEADRAYRTALAGAREVGAAVGLWQAGRALGIDVGAELDALAETLGEPGLRATLA